MQEQSPPVRRSLTSFVHPQPSSSHPRVDMFTGVPFPTMCRGAGGTPGRVCWQVVGSSPRKRNLFFIHLIIPVKPCIFSPLIKENTGIIKANVSQSPSIFLFKKRKGKMKNSIMGGSEMLLRCPFTWMTARASSRPGLWWGGSGSPGRGGGRGDMASAPSLHVT